ncbi:hypothetical protein L6164_006380 [Bauhinia variegata]|uniref:Uncharacterized protein n=1 Tax=Bauhinia variegata TaxID=167791 RepID=A0ACB9PTG6_BAUVA|nr:hypothetical protein L6164_006380 [Bauhinia variegata]
MSRYRCPCSFCCIYCTIYTIVFLFILSMFIFWLIFTPSSVKFHVTDTSLTQFNLTSNNTLFYNLKVNITVRNPNKDIVVYYRRITLIAWYKKRAFGWLSLAPFDQGRKNTTFLQAQFQGHQAIKLKPRHIAEYNEETRQGIYNNLVVDLDLAVKAKYGRIKVGRFEPPVVQCRLRVPLVTSVKSAAALFNVTRCKTGYFFVDRNQEAG